MRRHYVQTDRGPIKNRIRRTAAAAAAASAAEMLASVAAAACRWGNGGSIEAGSGERRSGSSDGSGEHQGIPNPDIYAEETGGGLQSLADASFARDVLWHADASKITVTVACSAFLTHAAACRNSVDRHHPRRSHPIPAHRIIWGRRSLLFDGFRENPG